MANPPITIGELVDVPAPGSSIASAWAQEATQRAVHRFTTTAARDAAYPAATAGRGAICVVGTVHPILYISNGSVWAAEGVWTTWAPTFTALTPLGTSTYECMRIGDQAFVRTQVNVGAGGVSGWPQVSLPWTPKTGSGIVGSCQLQRSGGVNYFASTVLSGSTFAPVYLDPTHSLADFVFISATVPFTWGSAGDGMLSIFNYQAVSLG